MPLKLRPTGLSSSALQGWSDYTVTENGRSRAHSMRIAKRCPELRWFWSITIYVDPKRGIKTNGRTATIEHAKEQFCQSWERVHAKQA
jgi:hypothetical protein